jgi:Mg-chelatase subunit ChlD
MGSRIFCAVVLCTCGLFLVSFLNAQDLSLSVDDLRIELRADGGYHLFIRCKPDISSVLLTETTRDPQFRAENYAYRTLEKNSVNGDEIRLIDGYPITPESRIYSLISSTPERHPDLGWAYHIYIPHVIYYGYESGRHGEVYVGDGTYLNIRAFYYAYADYRGPFRDNPFMIKVTQEHETTVPTGNYLKETVDAFTEIGGVNTTYSNGPSDLSERIGDILRREDGSSIDIVICLDTTGSMRPYIDSVRRQLIPQLREIISGFDSFRIGMVLFKDYAQEYITRVVPFTDNFSVFQRNLNAIRAGGGGDIPEAVYEALHTGATRLPWAAESKLMILIGDAPPHPQPRGNITKQMVDEEVAKRGITIHAIILRP